MNMQALMQQAQKMQRELAKAIKNARFMGLLPYIAD